jgi:hypothetical protein
LWRPRGHGRRRWRWCHVGPDRSTLRWLRKEELGGREHECRSQEGNRHDRHDECPGRAHGAPKDLDAEIRQPGPVLVAPAAIGEGGEDDPFVKVWRRRRLRQSREQAHQPRDAPELCRAGGALPKVAGEETTASLRELVQLIRVDERPRADAVQRLVDVGAVHTLHMTGASEKVASGDAPRQQKLNRGRAAPEPRRPDPRIPRPATLPRADHRTWGTGRRCPAIRSPCRSRVGVRVARGADAFPAAGCS